MADRPCEITVRTYSEKDTIVIRVEDNDIGIAQENYDAIFTKYYRVGNTVEGTGVGLYVVKEIVRGAGGDIKVDSVLGKGSTFTVRLKAVHPFA